MPLDTRVAKLETEMQRCYDVAIGRIFALLDAAELDDLAGPMRDLSEPELRAIANGRAEYTGPPITAESVKPTLGILDKMYSLATPDERDILRDVWALRDELEALQ